MSADDFAAYWDAFEKFGMVKTAPFAGRWFVGKHEIRDIITLKRAGWVPEPQTPMSEPMQWFWRRPLRPGSRDRKGKQFQSTNSAICELRRLEAGQHLPVQNWNVMVNTGGEMHPGIVPARGPLEAQRLADNLCGHVVGICDAFLPLESNRGLHVSESNH